MTLPSLRSSSRRRGPRLNRRRLPAWVWVPALAGAIGVLSACAAAHLKPIPPRGPIPVSAGVSVQASPVPLDPSNPARLEVDGFRYAGGVALTSADTSRLHGLSDLIVYGDGSLVAPSDDGDIFRGKLVLDADGRLVGVSDATLEPLRNPKGEPLQGKGEGDAEGAAQLHDGPLLISFERHHRIWRYAQDQADPKPATMPDVKLEPNEGMEGLAAFGARDRTAYWVGTEPGGLYLCRLDVSCAEVSGLPKPPLGYRLSGLAPGPNGELVILHHSYIPAIGSRIIVTIVRDPNGTKTVAGRLAMGPNSTVDNFEGVSVAARPNGDWRLYLLSDDNFNPKQRTLLLAFDWTPPK
ncbi:hypothetical protein CSW64_17270 [Caulobacter mirabilis]|uniref:Phytase-like domain-containing protein n=1 Tax=Caulobacter mirabilis TaxID=69666 RepID=A0A2D2B1A1_9CAUL|nr:hypothetical protein CSW64_17270 [Caulobacter mirabilis]